MRFLLALCLVVAACGDDTGTPVNRDGAAGSDGSGGTGGSGGSGGTGGSGGSGGSGGADAGEMCGNMTCASGEVCCPQTQRCYNPACLACCMFPFDGGVNDCRPSGGCQNGVRCGNTCCAAGESCDNGQCRCGNGPACTGGNICASPVLPMNGCGVLCCGAQGMPCPG